MLAAVAPCIRLTDLGGVANPCLSSSLPFCVRFNLLLPDTTGPYIAFKVGWPAPRTERALNFVDRP